MKTNLLIITMGLLFSSFYVNAQHNLEILDSLPDGTLQYANVLSKIKSATTEDSKSFLKKILKTEKGIDFYLYSAQTDNIGMTHEKYQQIYHGIKVAFCEYIVHKDKDGYIVSVNGHYGKLPQNITRTPKLSFDSALEAGMKKKKLKNIMVYQLQEEKRIEAFTPQRTDKY
jgi:Zn-dependent metalloprotease